MTATRILLIETLDAAGAAAHDARTRARALHAAGFEARCAIVESDRSDALHAARASADALVVSANAAGRTALRGWVAASQAGAALVASALPGGGAPGRWLAGAGTRAWWWPTGLAAAGGGEAAVRSGALPVLPGVGPDGGAGAPWPDACAGLEASVLADARVSRGQLPLWDGDYVLAPLPLSGAAGLAALDSFAALCGAHDGLDLVVLADPQPAFERLARERGIGFRVHFAGAATRDAELAWLSGASAALIAGDAPLSGGLVLRALARGCPVLAAPRAASAAPLEAWLAARGLGFGAPRTPLAARCARALTPDAAWRTRVAAALALHGIEAVGGRLAHALDPRRRHAA